MNVFRCTLSARGVGGARGCGSNVASTVMVPRFSRVRRLQIAAPAACQMPYKPSRKGQSEIS